LQSFEMLNLFGTAIFAISGAFAAARKGMDITGVLLLAFLVGNGGGTIRDVILGKGAAFWVSNPDYVWVALIAGVLAIILVRFVTIPFKLLLVADALGLGVFVVTGAKIALVFGTSPFIAILMGMLTGVGGSVLRDLICNEVPLILRHEIYSTAAFLGGLFFVLVIHILPENITAILSILIVFVIRVLAIYFDWSMPVFSHHWFRETRKLSKKGDNHVD